MSTKISAKFDITDWKEHQFDRHAGAGKLTKASVKKTYSGDITGHSVTEWLMAYGADGNATFVGVERIDAAFSGAGLAGRTGMLVIQHVGTFADGAARADLTVLPGTGSGDMADVGGTGHFLADPAGSIDLELQI